MTPLSFLLLLQADDARLSVRATLDSPRLTYAEFGMWVGRTTGTVVTVSPAIRDRKATVLVEDRPVRETMERVAETFFLEWERTPGGYTLRLPPKVRDEEARQVEEEARLSDAAFRESLDEALRLGRLDDGALDEELRNAQKALDAAKGTLGERAAQDRRDRIDSMRRATGMHEAARILAELSDPDRQAVLTGGQVYASYPATSGMHPLFGDAFAGRSVSMRVYGDPENHELRAMMKTSSGGSGIPIVWVSSAMGKAYAALPLAKRMGAWAKADPGLLSTPLATPKRPIARHAKEARSLADLLVSLHERSGLPIVADGFREAMGQNIPPAGGGDPDGKDVGEWLGSFPRLALRPEPQARTSGGWLLMRRPGYWRQLPVEIPEGPIRALEAATARKAGPTLEDYAAFAGGLSPRQGRRADADWLAMDAPDENLGADVPFLRLWDALPTAVREGAERPGGVPLAALPPEAQGLARACLETSLDDLWDLDRLRYVLPGGPPLPNDLRLTVQLFSAPGWATPLRAASGQIGTRGKALATYSLTLTPTKT